jgi:hypothetical protein
MKSIKVLILDDNFVIANKVKSKLFNASNGYKIDSGIEIFPHYLKVDNNDPAVAAITVNNYLRQHEITYLLLDRGFGHIVDSSVGTNDNLEANSLYKDNSIKGYYIEELLSQIKGVKNNALSQIKGVIVYTYDNYLDVNKEGEVIKGEIIYELKDLLHTMCKIDVLLTYTDIYKIAEIDLYEGYTGEGLVKIGLKRDFVLYGMFVGELLYHKLLQMINARNYNLIKKKRGRLVSSLVILYSVLICINLGVNAISLYLLKDNNIIAGALSLLFGLLLPIVILWLKPSILLDIEEH